MMAIGLALRISIQKVLFVVGHLALSPVTLAITSNFLELTISRFQRVTVSSPLSETQTLNQTLSQTLNRTLNRTLSQTYARHNL